MPDEVPTHITPLLSQFMVKIQSLQRRPRFTVSVSCMLSFATTWPLRLSKTVNPVPKVDTASWSLPKSVIVFTRYPSLCIICCQRPSLGKNLNRPLPVPRKKSPFPSRYRHSASSGVLGFETMCPSLSKPYTPSPCTTHHVRPLSPSAIDVTYDPVALPWRAKLHMWNNPLSCSGTMSSPLP